MTSFKLNCSTAFRINIKNILLINGIQLTDDNVIFNQKTNKYIDVSSDYDILQLAGLKQIPLQYRIGGTVSHYWYLSHSSN